MKQGGDRINASGFTVIETLIVLAVSSILVASAMLIIGGKQNKTEFQTGINDLKSRLQQIVDETANGYYPGTGNFTCHHSSPAASPLKFDTGTSTALGSNGDCTFIGKVLRFGGPAGFDPATLTIYPVAGNRLNSSGQPVTSFAETRPTAIAQGNSPTTNLNGPALDSTETFHNGISLTMVGHDGSPLGSAVGGSNPFSIGVFGNPASASSGGGLAPGAEQFGLFGFGSWSASNTSADVVDNIDRSVDAPRTIFSVASVQLCFASGTTNQAGLITITSGMNVSLQIMGNPTCS